MVISYSHCSAEQGHFNPCITSGLREISPPPLLFFTCAKLMFASFYDGVVVFRGKGLVAFSQRIKLSPEDVLQ